MRMGMEEITYSRPTATEMPLLDVSTWDSCFLDNNGVFVGCIFPFVCMYVQVDFRPLFTALSPRNVITSFCGASSPPSISDVTGCLHCLIFSCITHLNLLTRILSAHRTIALISEASLLMVTSRWELLTPCMEALKALIYPLQPIFVYITSLPAALADLVQVCAVLSCIVDVCSCMLLCCLSLYVS